MATTTHEALLKPGKWQTLETVSGSVPSITHVFVRPGGVRLKVRYGVGWFGFDRQKQTTDGVSDKLLRVSGFVGRARFQARVDAETHVIWTRHTA
jgi:hypothetical protein